MLNVTAPEENTLHESASSESWTLGQRSLNSPRSPHSTCTMDVPTQQESSRVSAWFTAVSACSWPTMPPLKAVLTTP